MTHKESRQRRKDIARQRLDQIRQAARKGGWEV